MGNHLPCGIELPQVFFDGPVDMEHIRNFAIKAETLGYDSLWLQERVIGDFAMLEPVTLLSYVAAITMKVRLGTSVILLPLRNPIQLAKAYSTLDVMSRGRAILGVGLGGGHLGSHEDVFGYSREGRVTRFSEAVQIIKLLWTEPKASFQGRYWNFKDVSMEPKPLQKPHLPIIFGGHHENALRRAGAGTVPVGRLSRHSVGAPDAPGAYDAVVAKLSPSAAAAKLKQAGGPFAKVAAERAHGHEGPHLHIELASTPARGAPTPADN